MKIKSLFSRKENTEFDACSEFMKNYKPLGIEHNIMLLGLDRKIEDLPKENPFMKQPA